MRCKPGPWLQLAALLGVAGTVFAVVSGTVGAEHELISALALPPLAAVAVAAFWTHRQLRSPALLAVLLFGVAAAVTAPGLHVALGPTG